LQGKHLTACCKIVFVLGDAVGFDFFFVGQAQAVFAAVFTVGVPGGTLAYFERAGYVKGVGAELDDLLDALVLGAVGVGEGASELVLLVAVAALLVKTLDWVPESYFGGFYISNHLIMYMPQTPLTTIASLGGKFQSLARRNLYQVHRQSEACI
jgi:hypothetical protein